MSEPVDPRITIYLLDRGVEFSLSLGSGERLAKTRAYLSTLQSAAPGSGRATNDRDYYGLDDRQYASLKSFLQRM